MRILAFYFPRESEARAAQNALLREPDLATDEVQLAPIAVDGLEGTILALSVDEWRCPDIADVARRLGGRLVADVPEEWTRVGVG